MFYLSNISRNAAFLFLLISHLSFSGEGGLLNKLIYTNKQRFTRSWEFNNTSNSTGTVFDNTSDIAITEKNDGSLLKSNSDSKSKSTILNIENTSDNDYIPLHEITADTDKETLYRENALIKQKLVENNHLVGEDLVDHHHPIELTQNEASSNGAVDEPSVIIKGAKLITKDEEKATERETVKELKPLHVKIPPAHIIESSVVDSHVSDKNPNFLTALVSEEGLQMEDTPKVENANGLSSLNQNGIQHPLLRSDSKNIFLAQLLSGKQTGQGVVKSNSLSHADNSLPVAPNVDKKKEHFDANAVKQTLYDLTKSLLFNGNIGGTMVYIPKMATVSQEKNNLGTYGLAAHNTKNDNIQIHSKMAHTSLKNSPTSPQHMLDNTHIVNEINEELKAYHQNRYENEVMKSDPNIQLLSETAHIYSPINGLPQETYQTGRENNYEVFDANHGSTHNIPQSLGLFTSYQNARPNTPPFYLPNREVSQDIVQQQNQATHGAVQFPNINNTSTRFPYTKIRILCIGDSLTSGYYGDRHVYHPYSIMLGFLLNNNIADEFELITKGVGGEKVHQMHDRLKRYLMTEKPLDLVIILGGLNDLIKLDLSVDIYNEIVSLHELCHSYGVSTVSMTIPETHMPLSRQVYANYDQFLVVWGSLNERIRNYVSNWTIPCDLSRKFPLASLSDAEKHAWWSEDFIHPTIEGYNQIGRIVYGCIVSIL